VLDRLLEEMSYEAADIKTKEIKIDMKYVNKYLLALMQDDDLSRYIL
jgi:ATP-dependent HslUV protease ATP-binding subunit HslU